VSDWLDIGEPEQPPGLPVVAAIPADYTQRLALLNDCWSRLSVRQRKFLEVFRECRFNARAAQRQSGIARNVHLYGMHQPDYSTVVQLWRGDAASAALDRDRLLARQDDIVETLLTPKPILYQGSPTGLEEVDAGAAARANETLMQAAGILKTGKDIDVNVNVGVVVGPPTLNIQVMPVPQAKVKRDEGVIIDAKFVEVPTDEWLDA
jgi:hypothetical protein